MENGGSKLPFYLGGLSEVFWSRFQALSFRAIGRAKQTLTSGSTPTPSSLEKCILSRSRWQSLARQVTDAST